jgi:hypothetical protein
LHKQAQTPPRPVAEILEAGSREFLKQALERTPDLSAWTKLYAASQTLLAAMEQQRVVQALVEICSNLLACEQLAIVEIERQTRAVRFLGEEGLPPELRADLIPNLESLESRIEPGTPALLRSEGTADPVLAPLGISAIVPLWKNQESCAALFLFQLLPQRTDFDAEDREVLQLLSLYAGPCLRSQSGA